MTTFQVEIHVEDDKGEMCKQGRERHIKAPDVDQAYDQIARMLEKEEHLPPVRSMNVRVDGTIVVFLGHKEQAATPPEGLRHTWKRPPGPVRL